MYSRARISLEPNFSSDVAFEKAVGYEKPLSKNSFKAFVNSSVKERLAIFFNLSKSLLSEPKTI